jgi:hypothetical protein
MDLERLFKKVRVMSVTLVTTGGLLMLLGLAALISLFFMGYALSVTAGICFAALLIECVGGALLFSGIEYDLYGGHRPKPIRSYTLRSEKKPNPWQEQDSCWSIRRIGATFCFILSAALFIIGAMIDHMYAFYGGLAALVAAVLLLLFTTWSDLQGVAQAVASAMPGRGSSMGYGSSIGVVAPKSSVQVAVASEHNAMTLGKIDTSELNPPADPSVTAGVHA